MADQFAELLKDCRVGQEVRERRERKAAEAARATLAKAQRDAADAASLNRTRREIASLLKAAPAMAEEMAATARELNPGAALREKIEQARRGEAQALAQGKPELAMKIEAHRLQFERQFGGR